MDSDKDIRIQYLTRGDCPDCGLELELQHKVHHYEGTRGEKIFHMNCPGCNLGAVITITYRVLFGYQVKYTGGTIEEFTRKQ